MSTRPVPKFLGFRLFFLIPWNDVFMRIRVMNSTWYNAYASWYWKRNMVDRWKVEKMIIENKGSDKTGYRLL